MKNWACALLLAIPQSCQQALAAPLGCTGTIQKIIQYADGRMMIVGDWRGDFTMVCNTETTWNGISPGVCTKWYAAADIAYATGKPVVVSYADAGNATCANLPNYQSAPPPITSSCYRPTESTPRK